MLKKIFNADDFGMTLGVNAAIKRAYEEGILNSASLMVNQKYAIQAVEMAQNMPNLEMGLHLNLTNEKPAANPAEIPLLVGADGKLKNGFVNLLLLSVLKPKQFRTQVAKEVWAQTQKYLAFGLPLKHIDGHRHVHLIPAVFQEVKKIAEAHQGARIRIMNENIFNTIRQNKSKSWLFDGGVIKYIILRLLTWWNGYKSDTYFYTILYTCKLSKAQFENVRIPQGYKAVEVMIHPATPDIDRAHLADVWDESVLSPYRTQELGVLLDKNVFEGIN
ncbi:MAG: ChbG/HpnK family deacetylase [Alphaproteobacteria bacterium]|nr:ChbG/HpnK family deacetylase [Alphaproteobacteria bacterium]